MTVDKSCQNKPFKGLTRSGLGADHLTLEGGGGVGDFEKNFLQALVGRRKLHAAQM